MTQFLRRPLTLLDRVYNFVGGMKGVGSVDLNSDITLVHDVSREAERDGYGSFMGRCFWSGQVVSTIAGKKEEIVFRTSFQEALGFTDERYELWLIHAQAQCSEADRADITSVSLVAGRDTISAPPGTIRNYLELGTPQAVATPVGYWTELVLSCEGGGVNRGGCSTADKWALPIRTVAGGFLAWQVECTAANTVSFQTEMWAGRLGTTPPGLP